MLTIAPSTIIPINLTPKLFAQEIKVWLGRTEVEVEFEVAEVEVGIIETVRDIEELEEEEAIELES